MIIKFWKKLHWTAHVYSRLPNSLNRLCVLRTTCRRVAPVAPVRGQFGQCRVVVSSDSLALYASVSITGNQSYSDSK